VSLLTPGAWQRTCRTDPQAKEAEAMENYSCEACAAKFKSKEELDAHMQREHAQQPSEKTASAQEKREPSH